MDSQALSLIILIGWITAASCQTFPTPLQNNVFESSVSESYRFTTNTVNFTDTATGDHFFMTADGDQNNYYFGRYNITPGMETFACYKYESPANNFYRFIDYSMNVTSFPYGTQTATFASACNTSMTPTPEMRYAAVKQGAVVQGNTCPSAVLGIYSYVLDPSGGNLCSGLGAEFEVCGTDLEFDTSLCSAAQSYFAKTPASPEKKFGCMVEDPGVGGLSFITVTDPDSGHPGCIVYQKTGSVMTATYRRTRCLDNQTDTWVDSIGSVTSMSYLKACGSGASVVFPGLVALVAALLCNYL